jgi:acetyl-CoA carboxylase biotin carboxylase subunit
MREASGVKRQRFKKLLVANRGEIALRVIRTCRELSLPVVVVYSEADRNSLPVVLADDAVCVGPGPAAESYLIASRVLSAATVTGCDVLHPGYGFLSENPDFAEAAASCKMTFVGPAPDTMRLLGDKVEARKRMKAAGVPVVPGSDGPLEFNRATVKFCADIGYPVLVKAAAGGGGKGMRVIKREADLETGIQMCMAEAKRSFDDQRVYVEKYLTGARHVEIQVLGDKHGTTIHLDERDCSCQRRHQKLLEESPAPGFTSEQRERLGAWAVAAARAAGYVGAGTVEFIGDDTGAFYFMEMNARLQVEHPVTEMVTGTDIVRKQILIAAGGKVDPDLARAPRGHAIECRIYAEDPDLDFQPCPGFLTEVVLPGGPGIRVDSALVPRSDVPPFYDPLIAKVIAWAPDRAAAIARMDRALAETRIEGVKTTTGFLRRLLRNPRFQKVKVTTGMLDET